MPLYPPFFYNLGERERERERETERSLERKKEREKLRIQATKIPLMSPSTEST